MVSRSSPKRYATPHAAAQPALIAPQYADNLPINVFWWIAVRFETTNARYMRSSSMLYSLAYANTGIDTVMP